MLARLALLVPGPLCHERGWLADSAGWHGAFPRTRPSGAPSSASSPVGIGHRVGKCPSEPPDVVSRMLHPRLFIPHRHRLLRRGRQRPGIQAVEGRIAGSPAVCGTVPLIGVAPATPRWRCMSSSSGRKKLTVAGRRSIQALNHLHRHLGLGLVARLNVPAPAPPTPVGCRPGSRSWGGCPARSGGLSRSPRCAGSSHQRILRTPPEEGEASGRGSPAQSGSVWRRVASAKVCKLEAPSTATNTLQSGWISPVIVVGSPTPSCPGVVDETSFSPARCS